MTGQRKRIQEAKVFILRVIFALYWLTQKSGKTLQDYVEQHFVIFLFII